MFGDLFDLDFGQYAPMFDVAGIPFDLPAGTYFTGGDAFAPDFLSDVAGAAGSDGSGLYPSGTLYSGTNAIQGDFMTDPAGAPRTPATGDFSEFPSGTTFSGATAGLGGLGTLKALESLLRSPRNGNGGGGISATMPQISAPQAGSINMAASPVPQTAGALPQFTPVAAPPLPNYDNQRGLDLLLRRPDR